MIASWLKKIEDGQTRDHISAFWDVMPTLCEVSGAELPERVGGISFLPTLLGKRQKRFKRRWMMLTKSQLSKDLKCKFS